MIKYIAACILLVCTLTASSQTFVPGNSAEKYYTLHTGKYLNKKENTFLPEGKKLGTFFFTGTPSRLTFSMQNINGKIFLLRFDGLFNNPGIHSMKRISVSPYTIPQQAKSLYNTDKGTVFALPLDNMPCLVPDKIYAVNEQDHYKQYYPQNSMPNPFPVIEIIPAQQNQMLSAPSNK